MIYFMALRKLNKQEMSGDGSVKQTAQTDLRSQTKHFPGKEQAQLQCLP